MRLYLHQTCMYVCMKPRELEADGVGKSKTMRRHSSLDIVCREESGNNTVYHGNSLFIQFNIYTHLAIGTEQSYKANDTQARRNTKRGCIMVRLAEQRARGSTNQYTGCEPVPASAVRVQLSLTSTHKRSNMLIPPLGFHCLQCLGFSLLFPVQLCGDFSSAR